MLAPARGLIGRNPVASGRVAFRGIPLAEYQVHSATGATMGAPPEQKTVTLIELEPKDIPVLDYLEKRVKKQDILPPNSHEQDVAMHYKILEKALKDARNTLRLREQYKIKDPTVIYLAVADKAPCGLIMGNMPKINQFCQITYSNRNVPNEIELDWLVTFPIRLKTKLKGVGQLLVSRFFKFCGTKPDVKTIFVRSEVPEYSRAVEFYKAMGFASLQPDPVPMDSLDQPRELACLLNEEGFYPNTTQVQPMLIQQEKAQEIAKKIIGKFHPKELEPISQDIRQLVDLTPDQE